MVDEHTLRARGCDRKDQRTPSFRLVCTQMINISLGSLPLADSIPVDRKVNANKLPRIVYPNKINKTRKNE